MMMALLLFLFIFAASPWESNAGLRKPAGCDFFTKANAVKIIGEDITWTGTDVTDGEPKKWTCTFVSKANPDGPNLYFGLHRFSSPEKAREQFDAAVESNKSHAGFERLANLGDEAMVHGDGTNFHLVMVRKEIRSFRIKVNPAGATSMEKVKLVAEDLVRKMEEMGGE